MRRLACGGLLVAFLAVALGGCASDKTADADRVSTIPWNRPEKWEGQGALGGFAPNSH